MFRKRAFIQNWWIAKKGEKLKFVDIFKEGSITRDCRIVGQVETPFYEMETSRHPIVKVTKKGVYTASGRYYPFSTAHPLYLMYLKEIHSPGQICIAFNWKDNSPDDGIVVADVLFPDGECMKNITFDYISLCSSKTKAYGYSETLQCAVLFHSFDRYAVRPEYRGWISMMEVNDLAVELTESKKELVKEVSQILKRAK